MEDPKALQLFQEVLSKTRAGRIKWEPTANESEYAAVLPGGFTLAVLTYFELDNWGQHENRFALVLRGDEGELLRVTRDTDGVTSAELSELIELARRRALLVDARVDKL